jgi:lysozyme family protein
MDEEQGDLQVGDSHASEAVGTGNDERVARLNAIADQADSDRADELANVNDDGSTEPFKAEVQTTPTDEPPADAATAAATAEPEAVAAEKKFRIKVNGRDIELTESELIARASKIEAADEYLRLAKQRATPPAPPQPAGPSPEELQRQQDEEDRALVRAIQMGTEEEATAALRKLRAQTSASPSLSRDDVSRTIDERLSFNTAIEKFSTEYSDVWSDPVLKKIALDRDAHLIQEGDRRTYWERYQQVGEEVRAWKQQLVQQAQPAPSADPAPTIAEKQERKVSAPKVPAPANAKAKPARVEEEEIDDTPSNVIANMAKSRGGPQWMRG